MFHRPALGTGILFGLLLGIVLVPRIAGAAASDPAPGNRLVILSTSDLKGKTGPCGCHVPKGGLARIASFADSVRSEPAPVLLVTTGGFFPEQDDYQEVARFLMGAMKQLGTDAAGVSEKELRYGLGFLLANAKQSQLPLVCANLFDKATGKPLVPPFIVKKAGKATVGIFALTSDKADLGAASDSVTVEDPTVAARRTVEALRKKGATVVVLLSELGKTECEDLVTAVDGIDVAICGRNVPLLQEGRIVKNTIVCYGGEQGQYIGRTLLRLDSKQAVAAGANDTFTLGPDVGDQPAVLAMVRSFEDHFSDERRRKEQERAAAASADSSRSAPAANH